MKSLIILAFQVVFSISSFSQSADTTQRQSPSAVVVVRPMYTPTEAGQVGPNEKAVTNYCQGKHSWRLYISSETMEVFYVAYIPRKGWKRIVIPPSIVETATN